MLGGDDTFEGDWHLQVLMDKDAMGWGMEPIGVLHAYSRSEFVAEPCLGKIVPYFAADNTYMLNLGRFDLIGKSFGRVGAQFVPTKNRLDVLDANSRRSGP